MPAAQADASNVSFPLGAFLTSLLSTESEYRKNIALQAWRIVGDAETDGNNRGIDQYTENTVYKGQARDWCALSTAWIHEQVTDFAGTPKLFDFDTKHYLNSKDMRNQIEKLTRNAQQESAVFRYMNEEASLPQLGDILSVSYPVKREASLLEKAEIMAEDLGLKPREEWRWEKNHEGELNDPSHRGHTCTIISAEKLPNGQLKLLTIDGNSDSTDHGKAFVRMNEWRLHPDGTGDHIGSGTMRDKGCYAYMIDISKLPSYEAAEESLRRKKAAGERFIPTPPKDGQEVAFYKDAFHMLLGYPMQRSVMPPILDVPGHIASLKEKLPDSVLLEAINAALNANVKSLEEEAVLEVSAPPATPLRAVPINHEAARVQTAGGGR